MDEQAGGSKMPHLWIRGRWGTSTQKQMDPRERLSLVPLVCEQPSRALGPDHSSELEQAGALTKAIPLRGLLTLMSAV